MGTTTSVIAALVDALAGGEVAIVDLTHPLTSETKAFEVPPEFGQSPGVALHEISRYDERGPDWAWNWVTVGEHVGTHIDAPIHWRTGRDGCDVASIPPERLIGPAVVLDVTAQVRDDASYLLTVEDVRAFEAEHGPLPDGGWLLLRTGWDGDAPGALHYTTPAPGMTPECARYLAQETAIVGFGIDTGGIDGSVESDPPAPAHRNLLGADKYGLEQLANLDRLPATGSLLIVSPMALVGGTGSPTRAFALVPGA